MEWLLQKLSPTKLIDFFSTKFSEWGMPGISDFLKSLLGSGLIPEETVEKEEKQEKTGDNKTAETQETTTEKEPDMPHVNDIEVTAYSNINAVAEMVGGGIAGKAYIEKLEKIAAPLLEEKTDLKAEFGNAVIAKSGELSDDMISTPEQIRNTIDDMCKDKSLDQQQVIVAAIGEKLIAKNPAN